MKNHVKVGARTYICVRTYSQIKKYCSILFCSNIFNLNSSCTSRRPRDQFGGRDLVPSRARAFTHPVRRYQPRTVLQRRQQARWLWTQLHVHAQSGHPAQCHRGDRARRWRWTENLANNSYGNRALYWYSLKWICSPHNVSSFISLI